MAKGKEPVRGLPKAKLLKFKKKLEKLKEELLGDLRAATNKFKVLLDEYRENPGASADRAHPPYEESELLARRTRKLENIHKALGRIAAGFYGICIECTGLIEEKRLMARPTAPTCESCGRAADEEAERIRKLMNCRGTPGRRG